MFHNWLSNQKSLKAPNFLNLPREIRNDIYFILFNSTRLRFGVRVSTDPLFQHDSDEDSDDEIDGILQYIRPAPHSLAILRTCHQVNQEARDAWLSRVTFCFEDARVLVEKLHTLPDTTIAQIRYMHLSTQ